MRYLFNLALRTLLKGVMRTEQPVMHVYDGLSQRLQDACWATTNAEKPAWLRREQPLAAWEVQARDNDDLNHHLYAEPHVVQVVREHGEPLWFGPFPGLNRAIEAIDDQPAIIDACEEDALDCIAMPLTNPGVPDDIEHVCHDVRAASDAALTALRERLDQPRQYRLHLVETPEENDGLGFLRDMLEQPSVRIWEVAKRAQDQSGAPVRSIDLIHQARDMGIAVKSASSKVTEAQARSLVAALLDF